MNPRIAIGVPSALLVVGLIPFGGPSFSFHHSSDGSHAAVHLSQYALAVWPLAAFLVAASWRLHFEAKSTVEPRWYRVLLALYIDFMLYFVVAAVPFCLFALWVEGNAVGVFEWQFNREYGRPRDILTTVASVPVITGVFASMGILMRSHRQSPGGILAGIAVAQPDTVPLWRCVLFGFVEHMALAIPFFRPFFSRIGGVQARAIILEEPRGG